MSRKGVVAVVLLLLWKGAALAANEPPTPKGPPPRFAVVEILADGKLIVTEFTIQPEIAMFEFSRNGKVEKMPVVLRVVRPEQYRWEKLEYPLGECQFFDGEGQKLDRQDAEKRLKKGSTALLSADGKAVDPAYLKAVKKDTVILVRPEDGRTQKPDIDLWFRQ